MCRGKASSGEAGWAHASVTRVELLCADLIAIRQRMRDIRHKILVLSGKGGVGKSTFAAQLALALAASDRDVSGPVVMSACGIASACTRSLPHHAQCFMFAAPWAM